MVSRMFTLFAVLAAMSMGVQQAQADVVLIDSFDFGGHEYNGPGSDSEGPAVAGTLDGNRASSLTDDTTDATGSRLEINTPPPTAADGALSYSNDSSVDSLLTMTWTAAEAKDLTGGGTNDRIRLDFTFASDDGTLTFELTDSDTNTELVSHIVSTTGFHDFFFSEWSTIDFTAITEVVMTLSTNSNLGGDYAMDFVSAIPAPAALPAGLALLGGLALLRRKRIV